MDWSNLAEASPIPPSLLLVVSPLVIGALLNGDVEIAQRLILGTVGLSLMFVACLNHFYPQDSTQTAIPVRASVALDGDRRGRPVPVTVVEAGTLPTNPERTETNDPE